VAIGPDAPPAPGWPTDGIRAQAEPAVSTWAGHLLGDPTGLTITVTTPDGLTFTRKIEDRKNLDGVKPGDRIDITYSQALLIAAQPAK